MEPDDVGGDFVEPKIVTYEHDELVVETIFTGDGVSAGT